MQLASELYDMECASELGQVDMAASTVSNCDTLET